MLWILPALFAPLLWAATNIIDERLVKTSPLTPWALVIVTGSFASVPMALLFFIEQPWPGVTGMLLGVLAGATGTLVYFPYFRALQRETASAVILMWNLTPVLIVGLARLALGELLTWSGYAAVGALVASSLIAAYQWRSGLRWSAALPWMILASVLLAISSVLEKAVYERMPFTAGLAWISAGALGLTVFITYLAPRARSLLMAALGSRMGALLVVNEGLDLGAVCLLGLATSLGPVSLVHAVGGIQPVFVLVIASLLRGRPGSRNEIVRTAIAAGLAVTGFVLLNSATS